MYTDTPFRTPSEGGDFFSVRLQTLRHFGKNALTFQGKRPDVSRKTPWRLGKIQKNYADMLPNETFIFYFCFTERKNQSVFKLLSAKKSSQHIV